MQMTTAKAIAWRLSAADPSRVCMHIVLCLALAAAKPGLAVDAVMTNKVSASVSWNAVGNWTDSSGAALGEVPLGSGYNVSFAPLARPQGLAAVPLQTITIDTADGEIGSVSGDDRRIVQYTKDRTGNVQSEHWLRVADPSAFLGFWTVGNALSGFVVPDGAALSSISGKARPSVDVADSGATASIGTVYEDGSVDKVGGGTLSIGATTGDGTSVVVKDGNVVLEGGLSDARIEALLAQSAVHLDASDETTLVRRSEGGRVWVDEWTSVSDPTLKAKKSSYRGTDPSFITAAESPFISPVTSPTSLPMVDFGSGWKSQDGSLGPSNCLLELSRKIAGIKTVFYAVQGAKGLDCSTVIGGKTTYDFIANAWLGNTTLFASGAAKVDVLHGEYQLDGRQTSHEGIAADKLTAMSVLSIDLDGTGSATFDLLGSDRYLRTSSGGFRLGELLVFTNHLSRADRLRVSRHLVNKWKGNDADPRADVGFVRMEKATSSLVVPAGQEASVGSVDAVNKSLNKSGDGKLVLDVVTPAAASVNVNAGSVSFDKVLPDVVPSEPASGAYIWLDAHTLSGTEVSEWADCRQGIAVKATSLYTSPRVPTLVSGANGPAVNFGIKSAGTHAGMKFSNWTSTRQAYAGFIVVRMTALNQSCNIFGSSYMDMIRENATALASKTYAVTRTVAARWSINGRIVDPMANEGASLNQTNRFVLVGFTSQDPLAANGISQDRDIDANCGGIEVAEMIVYNRKITESERRQTEAYLMSRWGLGSHPAVGDVRKVGTMAFAPSVDARVGGSRDLDVGSVVGGSGTMVKTGSGAVSIAAPSAEAVSSAVRVEGGTLAFSSDPADLLSRAVFRFDAMDTGSLVCSYVDNGNGTVTTNVVSWLDASRNGYVARSTYSSGVNNNFSGVTAHPTVKGVVFADGVTRPVVDFGTPGSSDAAGFSFYSGSSYVSSANVREVFTVYSDVHRTTTVAGQVVGSSSFHFLHGPDWNDGGKFKLLLSYAAASVRNGYKAVDGLPVSTDYVLDKAFHVISFGATGNVLANMMCQERTNSAGGSQIAEQVAFNFELTAEERAVVESYLMRKWLGNTSRTPSFAVGAVELCGGAEFSVGDSSISMPSVRAAGGTAVRAGAVANVATLAVDTLSKDAPALMVEGTVAFANQVTVTIGEPIGRMHDGIYPLVRAASLENVDLSNWTLVCTELGGRKAQLVMIDGRTVGLKVTRSGMTLIVF